jgi:hypothetical protein
MLSFPGREFRVSPATKLVFKLALITPGPVGRPLKPLTFFRRVRGNGGVPVFILGCHGVEPEVLVTRLNTRMRDMELREERRRSGSSCRCSSNISRRT